MSTALDRYHAACTAQRDATPDELVAAAENAWDALTLAERLRVIFAVPWRDAVWELRIAVGWWMR